MSNNSATNVEMIMEKHLKGILHINNLASSTFVTIWNTSKIHHLLDIQKTKVKMQALVMSKCDYCNSILLGTPQYNIDKVQRIQNMACRVIFRLFKHAQVSTYLAELHWLKIKYHIIYTTAMLSTCADMAWHQNFSQIFCWQSATITIFDLRHYKSYQYHNLLCPTCTNPPSPHIWNSLPWNITDSVSLESFKSNLKIHLFKLCYNIN